MVGTEHKAGPRVTLHFKRSILGRVLVAVALGQILGRVGGLAGGNRRIGLVADVSNG